MVAVAIWIGEACGWSRASLCLWLGKGTGAGENSRVEAEENKEGEEDDEDDDEDDDEEPFVRRRVIAKPPLQKAPHPIKMKS